MARPRSANPSKATLRKRRYDERRKNEEGGPLRVAPILYSDDWVDVLVALGLLGQWDDENREAITHALSKYVAERMASDHAALSL